MKELLLGFGRDFFYNFTTYWALAILTSVAIDIHRVANRVAPPRKREKKEVQK